MKSGRSFILLIHMETVLVKVAGREISLGMLSLCLVHREEQLHIMSRNYYSFKDEPRLVSTENDQANCSFRTAFLLVYYLEIACLITKFRKAKMNENYENAKMLKSNVLWQQPPHNYMSFESNSKNP